MDVTTLRIKKEYTDTIDLAVKWYNIISLLNDFKWNRSECQIMAYAATRGDISSGGKKEEFCNIFKIKKGTLANLIGPLSKAGFLIKEEGKIRVHKDLYFNMNTDILLQLKMLHV